MEAFNDLTRDELLARLNIVNLELEDAKKDKKVIRDKFDNLVIHCGRSRTISVKKFQEHIYYEFRITNSTDVKTHKVVTMNKDEMDYFLSHVSKLQVEHTILETPGVVERIDLDI